MADLHSIAWAGGHDLGHGRPNDWLYLCLCVATAGMSQYVTH
jgi:hypothetical protein